MAPFERVNCCWCMYMYTFNSLRTCLDFDFNSPVTPPPVKVIVMTVAYLDMVLMHSLSYISAFNKERASCTLNSFG